MTGGLIQISSFGNQDIMLTGNPEITFFNVIYRRYTNFGVKFVETSFDNNVDFNKTSSLMIPKNGDLLSNVILKIKLPGFNINNSSVPVVINETLLSYYDYLIFFKDRLTFVINNFFNTDYSNIAYMEELKQYILKNISIEQYIQYFYTVTYLYNLLDGSKGSSGTEGTSGAYYKNCSLFKLNQTGDNLIYIYQDYSNNDLNYNIFKSVIYENLQGIEEFNKIVYNKIVNSIDGNGINGNSIDGNGINGNGINGNSIDGNGTNNKILKLAWIDKIAIFLFNTLDIYIGSNPINQLSADYINIFSELKYQNKQLYNSIIGNESKINTPTSYKDDQYLYLPIPFWFTQNYGLAFPLIALQYNNIELRIKTKKIEECLHGDLSTLYEDIINNYDNIFTSQLEISAIFEYVYLDNVERRKFAQSSHEYLITQVQYNYFNNFNNGITNINVDLNFNHCSNQLMWFINSTNTFGNNNYDKYYINYTNHPNKNQKYVYLKESSIILNGTVLINEEYKYYNFLQPYNSYKSTPSLGVNVYSFALNPLETQPSGTCNFSRIPKTSLHFVMNDADIIGTTDITLKVINVNYNILRIIGGIAGLAYTY
jgi:hypothetical protein